MEIGSFHGAITYFMFNNLSNKQSIATVIDPFENSISEAIGDFKKFKNNLGDYLERITIHKNYSINILDSLEKEYYDIIYVDGSHTADDVYYDLTHTFPLLKRWNSNL